MKTTVMNFGLTLILFLGSLLLSFAQKQPNGGQPGQIGVNYTEVNLTEQETARILGQGENLRLGKQVEALGYQKGKTVKAIKFVGKDGLGAFEIIVIERDYTATTAGKSIMNSSYYEAKRAGKSIATRVIASDDQNAYQAGAEKLSVVVNSSKALDCFSTFINSTTTCTSLVNSIKACISTCPKNKKGKPTFFCVAGCVLSNAQKAGGCIKDVVKFTGCIINSL